MIDTRVSTKPLYSLPGWKPGEPAGPVAGKVSIYGVLPEHRSQEQVVLGRIWELRLLPSTLYPTRQLQSVLGKTDELLAGCLKVGKGALREKQTFRV